jgi:hypothetical protein
MRVASSAIGFLLFIFELENLIRIQISELLHAKMNPTNKQYVGPTYCLFGSQFACSQNAGETSIVLWITAR